MVELKIRHDDVPHLSLHLYDAEGEYFYTYSHKLLDATLSID